MRYAAPGNPVRLGGPLRPGAERLRKSLRASARRWRRRSMSADRTARLRRLPAVDQVLREVGDRPETVAVPRPRLTALVRDVLDAERRRIMSEDAEPPDAAAVGGRVLGPIGRQGTFSLKPVNNGRGVALHTNRGRAPLSALALERIASVAEGYSNLELDLASKERGSRYAHVEELLRRLTGAEDALVVNNNAAAVLLALETLAHGKEVIVSRGELIEIGGEFRIPDIMLRSGAVLREVGTTNRTHVKDYQGAIGPNTGLLLKVHTSNYRVVGFTADVSSRELVAVGHDHGVSVMEDLGSGSLIDLRRWGFPYEPTVQEVIAAGVDLVSFSGDKLLGGPQAGIVVGRRDLVGRLKKNPWNRPLRIDKLTLAALEATLYAYDAGQALESVPTLQLLTEPLVAVRRRAQRLVARLGPDLRQRLGVKVIEDRGQVGGGALPTVELPTAAVALGTTAAEARYLDEALRRGDPPAIGRLVEDRLLLDCRTVLPAQINALAAAISAASSPG